MGTWVFIKAADPYTGRKKPKPTQAPKTGGQLLRQPSRQPDGSMPKASRGGLGDVTDPYLRGNAGGTAHPYYLKQKTTR